MPAGPEIPAALVDDILEGRCVAFVGAGFSAAAKLPTWKGLLQDLAATPNVSEQHRRYVAQLLEQPHPSAVDLDQAAQLLEDGMGREDFVKRLRELLPADVSSPRMRQRLEWLRGIPFRAIVTTNFDPVLRGDLPGPKVYRAILRPRTYRWWSRAFWDEKGLGAPVIKLHGDVTRAQAAAEVVLTRRDYRRRLYHEPGYMPFLHGLLSTNTVLFMGFSFSDAYLNELRSQVLALFDYREGDPKLAYALLADVPEAVQAHYEAHEGIEVLAFPSEPDHQGFDDHLQAIWEKTAVLPRFTRLLTGKRILWVDPEPRNNQPGFRFLRRATGNRHVLVAAGDVDAAMESLAKTRFDLVITHWGPQDTAPRLLQAIRRADVRCPVVVFSGDFQAEARKRDILALGAQDYCVSWESLLHAIDRIFSSVEETG